MKHRWLIAAVGATTLVVAGCGSDSKTATTSASAPATTGGVEHLGGGVDRAAARRPATRVAPTTTPAGSTPAGSTPAGSTPGVAQKIVSLSPTATEMLYAIGAGDQVVAVDEYSELPGRGAAEAARPVRSAIPTSRPSPSCSPTSSWSPTTPAASATQLKPLGIDIWVGPAAVTFDDIYTQLEQLGAATGHVAEAAKVVGRDADRHQGRRRRRARHVGRADLLPRARQHLLQRHLEHVPRHGLRPVRAEEHRRRRRRRATTTRSCRRSSSSSRTRT